MRPLPATRYEPATSKTPKVNIDYHVDFKVDVDRHYYSVPYQLVGYRVEARVSEHMVEIFYQGRRVAGHRRSRVRGGHTTCEAHMPERHRAHLACNPQRIIAWAARTGPATAELVTAIMASRPHPELGYRSCLGILRLAQRYPTGRVEAACRRALLTRRPLLPQRRLHPRPRPRRPTPARRRWCHRRRAAAAGRSTAPARAATRPRLLPVTPR